MLNEEMRTVTMTRSDMLRVEQALTRIVLDFRSELRSSEITVERRKACKNSLDMWERILNDFEKQMDEQDPEDRRLNASEATR